MTQAVVMDWEGLGRELLSFIERRRSKMPARVKTALERAAELMQDDDDKAIVGALLDARNGIDKDSRGSCLVEELDGLVRIGFAVWMNLLTPRVPGGSDLERHLWRAAGQIRAYLLRSQETSSLRRLYAQVYVAKPPSGDPVRGDLKSWFTLLKRAGLCNSQGEIPGVKPADSSGLVGGVYRLHP
ncbi:MAG: hypothetical protein KDD66_17160, partial [Bdellovibrionales bacterium]|nr:hypothetical protein [Bdellovibrionales bacterium]